MRSSQTAEEHDLAEGAALSQQGVVGEPNPPIWFRLFFPSIADLIFVVLLVSLAYGALSQRLLGDADIGWHIRDGQHIVSTRSLPHGDPFSSTMSGKPWYAWEWLYDAAAGIIHSVAGLNGVVVFSALVIALTFTMVFRIMLARGTSPPLAVVLLLLAASASTIHFLARPHILSWLFAVIWLWVLDSWEMAANLGAKRLYWLPALMLLWVNLHGGFLLGFALTGIYLIAAGIQRLASGNLEEHRTAGRRAKNLVAVIILCAVASVVNPFGYKLHTHIYGYLSNRFLMDHIDEFQSPNFHGVAQKCFAALVLVAMLGFALKGRQIRTSHLLLALFATYAGLYAARNIPVSSILLVVVMSSLLEEIMQGAAAGRERRNGWQHACARLRSFTERMGNLETRLHWHAWPAVVVLLSVWICLHHGRLGAIQVMDARFDGAKFPVQATDILMQEKSREPVFSLDSWGGYLIYRLYPQRKVVVDDRHDLYGEQFLKEYLRVVHVEPGWDRVLDQWKVNCVLLPGNSALSSVLKGKSQWRIVHDDGVAILFERSVESK